jgi:hypothetical protein
MSAVELDLTSRTQIAKPGEQPLGGAALAHRGGRPVNRAQGLDGFAKPRLIQVRRCVERLFGGARLHSDAGNVLWLTCLHEAQ